MQTLERYFRKSCGCSRGRPLYLFFVHYLSDCVAHVCISLFFLMIVFVETKKGCDMLTRSLRADGFQARAMHGDKSQEERDWVLREFKSCQATLLVATDVAARGLDVDDIRMVVNFDMPNDMESYIHRIGRTGRAGKKGTAISFFVSEKNSRMARELVDILNRTSQNIPPELQAMANTPQSRGGGRGRGRGGRRF